MSVTISDFGASGASHSSGVVPDPGSTSGTSRFLREDATWDDPNSGHFFKDIASQCTSLVNLTSPPTLIQLSAGGDAILTLPAGVTTDGKVFRVTFAARLYCDGTSNTNVGFNFGSTTAGNFAGTSVSPPFTGYNNVSVIANLSWDSTVQKLYGDYLMTLWDGTNVGASSVAKVGPFSASSDSDIKFCVDAGSGSGLSNTCSATLTQFSIEY